MQYAIRTFLTGTALAGVLVAGGSFANAQTVAEDAVRVAKTIGENQLFLSNLGQYAKINPAIDAPGALRLQRHKALRDIAVRDDNTQPPEVVRYAEMAQTYGTDRDQEVAEFLQSFIDVKPMRGSIADPDAALAVMDEWLGHDDWFVAHMAKIGKVQIHADEANISYALQLAVEAYQELLRSEDPWVLEAQSNTLTVIAMLRSITNDFEGAVRATEETIKTRQQLGFPVDGETLITNMAYVATSWGEQELGLDILAYAPASGQDGIFGLTELRKARLLVELGHFQEALSVIESVENDITLPALKNGMRSYMAIAHAGLGDSQTAHQIISELQQHSTPNRAAAQVDLLLAAREGRATDALLASNDIVRNRVQAILHASNADIANFLATLDNANARQLERQAALQREARDKQLRARMATAIAILLALVAALLGALALFATRFARWRTQNAILIERLTIQAESADQSKRNFLGMMSHELRTPLNGVIGLADHLSTVLHEPANKHLVSMISESGYDLLDVVENILDMAQIDTGQMVVFEEALDIRGLVDDVAALWRPMITSTAHGRNVRFTTFVDPNVPEVVELDPTRMRQILNQLLSNAGKFTHTGRVHLHVTAAPATEAEGPDGEMGPPDRPTSDILLVVADTGMGLNEEARSRLFEPFVQADTSMTRKFGGSGLGLAITRSLARIMHGDIEVISNLGRGSEFRLSVKAPILDRPTTGLTSHIPSPLVATEEALMVRRNSKPSQFWNPGAPLPDFPTGPELPSLSKPAPETLGERIRHWAHIFRVVMSPARKQTRDLPPEIAARAERQANATKLKRRRVSESGLVLEAPRPQAGLADDEPAQSTTQASVPAIVATMTDIPEPKLPEPKLPEPTLHVPGRAPERSESPVIEAIDRFHPAPVELSDSPSAAPSRLRIIAAEDVVMNQRVLEALIDGPDAQVTCVGTAEDLIAAHAETPFDIIIMDIHMPGMGGVQGIRELRKADRTTPVIALTADVGAQTNARALQAGADLFLTKPVIGADLREAFAFCATLNRDAA